MCHRIRNYSAAPDKMNSYEDVEVDTPETVSNNPNNRSTSGSDISSNKNREVETLLDPSDGVDGGNTNL